jgi:excisionase family DNA binding protein
MELLTRHEAARRLQLSLRTLDRRIATGDIQVYRLGEGPRAPVRISEEQLAEYLQGRRTKNVSEAQEQAVRIIGNP